jgi:hypothetical protein
LLSSGVQYSVSPNSKAMADAFDDAFRKAATSDKDDMRSELEALYRDRERDKHRCAATPKLSPPGPGGGVQRGADNQRLVNARNHVHTREKRIRYLELSLGSLGIPSTRTGGKARRR